MIDWDRVNELRIEVGEDDFDEVLAMFFDEAASVLANLGNGGMERIKRDLHLLKGSAINIGLAGVGALCRNCEAALAANPNEVPDLIAIRRAFLTSKEIVEGNSI